MKLTNEQIREKSLRSMGRLQDAATTMAISYHSMDEYSVESAHNRAMGYLNQALSALGLKAVEVEGE